jgi:spore maturation protein CgeB
MYLSFSRTAAGFENLKVGVLDAAAQGACVLTHQFSDIENFFNVGSEILTYHDSVDLLEVVSRVRASHAEFLEIGLRAQQRVAREHLWAIRWTEIFDSIANSPDFGKDG